MSDDYPIKIVAHQTRPTIEQLYPVLETAAFLLGAGWRFEPVSPNRPRPRLLCPEGDFWVSLYLARQGEEWRLHCELVAGRNELRAYDDYLSNISLRADRVLGAAGGLDLLLRELRARVLPGIETHRWQDRADLARRRADEERRALVRDQRRSLMGRLYATDPRPELWQYRGTGDRWHSDDDVIDYYVAGVYHYHQADEPYVLIGTGRASPEGRLAGQGHVVSELRVLNLSADEAELLLAFVREQLFAGRGTLGLQDQEERRARARAKNGAVCASFWCERPLNLWPESGLCDECYKHRDRHERVDPDGLWPLTPGPRVVAPQPTAEPDA